MLRTVVVAGALLLSVSAVVAQQDIVDKTQKLMKDNGRNAMLLGAMAKGDKPYDQAAVDAALKQFDETAKELPKLFPASVKGLKAFDSKYSSSPKIWDERAKFDAEIADFAKAVNAAQGKIKDVDTLKASFQPIGKQCGSCHETFRLKDG
ncbi:cytochrome c, class II [Rhodopseudomonas palustris BisB5]|uniref:Cytochrome c, class II n=1 Tax=Rhodopseudomonas palustris (strain BisB5) TaxID=316057 RepID=Q13AM7_RHOPS|nr:cytochrome c, class II [Rhodopseudomonas palustris BisB5]